MLIEAVPNFSEGRDGATLAAIRDAIEAVSGARLLDVHADRDHHRSVFTLVGEPEVLTAASLVVARVAVERIDLRRHQGVHPRIGALDVLPFVPLEGSTMDDCVRLAERVAEGLAEELGVATFLYGAAGRHPEAKTATDVRRRAFTEWVPDFGPAAPHPTAGATAVGARDFLVAFNVLLESGDVVVARKVARAIRESSGGLPGVQARGFLVRGRAQVSMNLLALDRTRPLDAFQAVEREAAVLGVSVKDSEIVGLAPGRALSGQEASRLKLTGDWKATILEQRLKAPVDE